MFKDKKISFKTVILIILGLLVIDGFSYTDQIMQGYRQGMREYQREYESRK